MQKPGKSQVFAYNETMFKPRTIKTIQIHKDKWSQVIQEIIDIGTTKLTYTYTKRNNGVVGLVINSKQEVLLIKQYRPPTKQYSWELPGGGIDPGESAETALKREIKEEAGVKVKILENWGVSYPIPSLASEKGFLYLCKTDQSIPKKIHGEKDELIEQVSFVSLDTALKMVETGKIIDSFTAMALYKYSHHLVK